MVAICGGTTILQSVRAGRRRDEAPVAGVCGEDCVIRQPMASQGGILPRHRVESCCMLQGIDERPRLRSRPGSTNSASAGSNRLEALRGNRAGQYSIRLNAQWRICFRWTDDGPSDVEIVDYH